MKVFSFKQFLEEEDSKAIVQTGINSKGLDNSVTREIINSRLVAATNHAYLTPYIALGNIARILAYVGIVVPQYTFLDREEGEVVFDAPQFGQVAGVNIDGTPAIPKTQYFIYFSYAMNEDGYYDCFAALVDIDELDNIMDEGEDTDPDEVHNAQKLGEEPVNEEDHEDEDKKKVNEEMHPRQKIPNGAFVKVTNSRDSNRHEVVDFEPGEHSAQDTYYTVTHLRKPGSKTKFTRSPPKKYDNPGIPDLPGIPRAAAQIHKLNPSNTTNEEHLHEKMDWEEKQGTSIPHLDQSTLKAHEEAADWHKDRYITAMKSGDTTEKLFHRGRMDHHNGMVHTLERQGFREEVESIDERKSSDPKGLAYKVTAASHAAHPEWGPADHTKDPKTHFGTAATRSSTLAAVKAIRGNRNFDANNPSHVDAAAKAVHGSPEDHGGKPKGWSQTAMTHSGQTPEQKERRAKLTGPYSGLSDDEKEKDREIVRTVASNIKKK